MYNNEPIICGDNNFYFLFSIIEYEGIPILFVAKDDFNDIYLCDCVEFRNFQRWIISKTSLNILELVIEKKISIFNALKQDDSLKIIATYDYLSGQTTQERIVFENISQEDLPEQEAYACMISENASEHLQFLKTVMYIPNEDMSYWNALINNTEHIAQSGHNIDNVIAILSKALGILKKERINNGI